MIEPRQERSPSCSDAHVAQLVSRGCGVYILELADSTQALKDIFSRVCMFLKSTSVILNSSLWKEKPKQNQPIALSSLCPLPCFLCLIISRSAAFTMPRAIYLTVKIKHAKWHEGSTWTVTEEPCSIPSRMCEASRGHLLWKPESPGP